jgi:hypothetical protein
VVSVDKFNHRGKLHVIQNLRVIGGIKLSRFKIVTISDSSTTCSSLLYALAFALLANAFWNRHTPQPSSIYSGQPMAIFLDIPLSLLVLRDLLRYR